MLLIPSYPTGTEPLLLPLPFGGWFYTCCLCPSAPSRAAWLELCVSCWFKVPLTQVHLEELGFWGWFGGFFSPLGLILKRSCPKACIGGSGAFGHLHESTFVLQNPRGLELSYMGCTVGLAEPPVPGPKCSCSRKTCHGWVTAVGCQGAGSGLCSPGLM